MRTIAGHAPRGCCGGLTFPTAAPSSSLCVRYWLVTRNEPVPNTGARRDTPELPVEVCREGFLRLAEQVGAQVNAQVLTEREMLQEDRPIPALVADANVILSSLTGGPARRVVASAPGALATRAFRRRMSANAPGERGAQTDPAAWGCSQAALLGRMRGRAEARAATALDFRTAAGARGQRGALRAADVLCAGLRSWKSTGESRRNASSTWSPMRCPE